MPPFAFTQIKKLYPIFWRHSILSTAAIKQAMAQRHDKNSEYMCNINDWASRVTLDMIGEAGMGRSFHSVDNPNNEIYKAYSTVFHQSSRHRVYSMVKTLLRNAVVSRAPYLAQFFPVDGNNPVVKAIRLIRGTCRELIEDGRNIINTKKEAIKDSMFEKSFTKDNLLLSAVSSEAFSDEELVNQAMTFLLAGHESTASTLTMAVYFLCKHLEVQKRLREEIRNHISSPQLRLEVTANDIRSLPYFNAVTEEVMRLAPAVPISGRVTVAETQVGQQIIPKGTSIILASAAINTSKGIWGEDALNFVPERWLTGGRIPKSPFANMTFLQGPRSCMGKDFARSTFACVLAAWVGRFEMTLQDPTFTPTFSKTSLSLRVEGGVQVKMKEVDGW
jgi:cytochrome P450